jgi:hypothetical protein
MSRMWIFAFQKQHMCAEKWKSRKRSGTKPGTKRVIDAAQRVFARQGFHFALIAQVT